MKEVKQTSEKLLNDCDQVIRLMEEMKALIIKHASGFDKFGMTSSASSISITNMIFLHDAPADVKDFCRAVGGEWVKEASSSGGGFNYEHKGQFHIIIHHAEKKPAEKLVL